MCARYRTQEQREKHNKYMKQKYHSSEKYRNYSKSLKLQRTYGISIEQYNYWNEAFDRVCHLCSSKCPSGRNLAVDHNHKTGLVRGLLCINCNKGLGNFKDNKELLNKAINYLKFADETEEYVSYAVNQIE